MGIIAMSSEQRINTEKEIQCALDTSQFSTLAISLMNSRTQAGEIIQAILLQL